MRIDRVVIRNFRNFESVDIKLESGVTCIIGDNNAGKTNLLHAIRLVCDSNFSNQARQLTEHDFHAGVDPRIANQVLISLEFVDFLDDVRQSALMSSFEIDEGRARLCFRFRPRAKVIDEIADGERSDDDLTIDDYSPELTAGGDGDAATVDWNQPFGQRYSLLDLQGYQVTFLHALRDVVADLRKQHVSPLKKLLSTIEMTENERLVLINLLKTANAQVSSDSQIRLLGRLIKRAFRRAAGETYPTNFKVGISDPSWASVERALSLLLSNRALVDFEPYRNGLGLNNVLYVCMLVEYFCRRGASKNCAGQLLLIEEPEAHIHPQLQRVLHKALEVENVQTLITTHSTHVTSNSSLSSYVVLSGIDKRTDVVSGLIDSAALSEREVADIERYLDATRSTLLFARKVILVEGPAELFVIPILVKSVLKKDLDRLGIAVIPIHGKHFGSYSKLFGPQALRKKCAIVADGDLLADELEELEDELADGFLDEELSSLQNEYVRVFQCESTFEREITMHGLLAPLRSAAKEVGATRIASWLNECIKKKNNGEDTSKEIEKLQNSILSLSKRVGKARFAQVLSRLLAAM
ncbi:MAG: AAA family ATPase [Candidatus Obscuribacterales bacterium]